MKKHEVEVGRTYVAKVSGRLTRVRLTGESPYGGWNAVNVETGRAVRIKTAARLRREAGAVRPSPVGDLPNDHLEVAPVPDNGRLSLATSDPKATDLEAFRGLDRHGAGATKRSTK